MKTMLAAAALAAAMSAHALAADAPKCPFADEVTGFTERNETTVLVDVGGRYYEITFAAPCRAMQDANRAKVNSKTGVCLEAGDSLIFPPRPGENNVCQIKTIEQVTPVAAPPKP